MKTKIMSLIFFAVLFSYTEVCFSSDGDKQEIEKVYYAYLAASQKVFAEKNFDYWLPFAAPEEENKIKQLIASSKEDKDQYFSMAKMMLPVDPKVVDVFVEGDKAILLAEGFASIDIIKEMFAQSPMPGFYVLKVEPYDQRDYNIVQFKKLQGKWFRIYQISTSYQHPLPVFQQIGDDKIDYMKPGYHCNFKKNPDSCGDNNFCWQCFADLNLDEVMCQNMSRDLEKQDKEFFKDSIARTRNQCIAQVARIKQDPNVCESLPEEGSNSRKDCRRWTNKTLNNFLPSIKIYEIDSDGDGLTDVKERFFNTSIGNADTDGDGASDFEEAMVAFSNPLGEGRLGDHLKPIKSSRFIGVKAQTDSELVIGENLTVGMTLVDAFTLLGLPKGFYVKRGIESEFDSISVEYPKQGVLIHALTSGTQIEGIEVNTKFAGHFDSEIKIGDHFKLMIEKYGVPKSFKSGIANYPDLRLFFILNKDKIVAAKVFAKNTKLFSHRRAAAKK